MTPDEQRALAELRFEYAPVPEDIWRSMPHHVDGLQPSAERAALSALADARRSDGPSPLGLVLSGQRGAGKTHLLGLLRQQVHANGGYFFLVGLLDAGSFWDSVLVAVVEGLSRPWGGADHNQAKLLLFRLGERIGAPQDLMGVLTGVSPVTPDALDELSRVLRSFDRTIAQRCGMTARALALYVSDDIELQEVAETYLQGHDDELGLRAAWGLRSQPRLPEELIGDLTTLMSLSGPVVIAVDQIDTLIAQSVRSLRGQGNDQPDLLLLEQIAGGLMALREKTRRTLTVVACLPGSWALIRDHATDTVQDRFREAGQLRTIPTAELGRQVVERRFADHFTTAGFSPPYPTWPVAPEAFSDAPGFTPRELLRRIDRHIRSCEDAGEIVELRTLDPTRSSDDVVGSSSDVPAEALATLDRRFAELRRSADPDRALDAAAEDELVPPLLSAGLAAWVLERGQGREAFSVDPAPGRKPPLHARLRQTLDEDTEDQLHWSFRAVGHQHFNAELARLRKACTAAAVTTGPGRHLTVLRVGPWATGARTEAAVGAFEVAGGCTLAPTGDDLRTLSALRQLQDEDPDHHREWLESRQIATNLALFAHLAPAAAGAAAPSTPRPTHRSAVDPGPGPAAGAVPAPDPGSGHDPVVAVDDHGCGLPLGIAVGDEQPVTVPLDVLRKHIAIFAGSGSGKTVLIRRLVEECALRGVSAIVLDPNNDLARLGDPWPTPPAAWSPGDIERAGRYHADTEVVIWTPRREGGRPLTFQPLPDFASVVDDIDEFNEAVAVAVASIEPRVNLTGQSDKAKLGQAVLRKAVEHYGRSGGGDLRGLARLLANLPYGVSDLGNARKIAANLAQLLTAAMDNDPLFGGAGTAMDPGMLLTPAAGKRARISVISFVGLPADADRQGFVNQLQMALFAWIKRNPAVDRPLGGLLVMDEAQNFAPSGAGTPCTESTLALASQARKYGLGLVFATQAPKGLHNRIPGNATTQFFGRLNAPIQVAAAREMAAAKGGAVADISRLGTGQFYASLENGEFTKLRSPLCLSHHPASPLTTEEVVSRAREA